VEGGGEGRGMGTTSFWTLPPPLFRRSLHTAETKVNFCERHSAEVDNSRKKRSSSKYMFNMTEKLDAIEVHKEVI